jgi:Lar family restriction alleviation protein
MSEPATNAYKLRECPFCGGEATYRDNGRYEPVIDGGGAYVDIDIQDASVFIVECSCGAQIVSDESEEEATSVWNRRAQEGEKDDQR